MGELNSYDNYQANQQGYNQSAPVNGNQYGSGYSNNGFGYNQNSTGYTNSGYGSNQNSAGYTSNGYNQNPTGYTSGTSGYNQNLTGYSNGGQSYQTPGSYTGNQMSYSTPSSFGYFQNQPNRLSNTNGKKKVKVSFNSPAVLTFAIVCLVVYIIQYITGDMATYYVFSVYRSSLLDPLTYIRFFGHALGHADLDHYMGNMMYLLIVGPLLEEKYGSKSIVLVMVVTAFVTGVFNFLFCPDYMTLGASGIVFAFILLSSLTCMKQGEIPLTFIVVAILYLGEQFLEAALVESNISNMSHIVGGVCGCVLGYLLNKNKFGDSAQNIANFSANSSSNITGGNSSGGSNTTYY